MDLVRKAPHGHEEAHSHRSGVPLSTSSKAVGYPMNSLNFLGADPLGGLLGQGLLGLLGAGLKLFHVEVAVLLDPVLVHLDAQ